MNKNYTDTDLVEGLLLGRQQVFEYIYHEYGPYIKQMVRMNSGSLHDMEDLMQDAMMVLYARCKEQNFILTCTLRTYFTAICRNLWLQRLERKFTLLYQSDMEAHEPHCSYSTNDFLDEEIINEKERLMYKHLRTLPADCQRLLILYLGRIPYTQISSLLGIKSGKYLKSRKYSCKKILRMRMKNDPECQQFFNYEK
jgi:RNA polymerase sigma factor (sigma-70 family)